MELFERVKTTKLFNELINKTKKKEYKGDLSTELINSLEKLEKEGIITDDFLKDIKVLVYVLDKCNSVKSGEQVHLGG